MTSAMPGTILSTQSQAARMPNGIGSRKKPQVLQPSRLINWEDTAPHTPNSSAACAQRILLCDHIATILLPFLMTMQFFLATHLPMSQAGDGWCPAATIGSLGKESAMSKLLIFRWWRAVLNVHERRLPVPTETAGRILDSLASADDLLWPREKWAAARRAGRPRVHAIRPAPRRGAGAPDERAARVDRARPVLRAPRVLAKAVRDRRPPRRRAARAGRGRLTRVRSCA